MVNEFNSEGRPRALLLYGGWSGHWPKACADFAAEHLLDDFRVVRAQNLDVLRPDVLSEFDLLAPIWTFGELTNNQEQALLDAVANGLGVLAWHGAASAFLNSRPHKHMLGGQFVAHPGGADVTYAVRFLGNDALVAGLQDVTVTTEQYYLLVDPAVKMLATTRMHGGPLTWTAGVEMPVAWTRRWGKGKVFYCALGHSLDVLQQPSIAHLLRRAAGWASRGEVRAIRAAA
ncbi:MAG: ThuA domain-containing protein [Planctomycetia bacterium]|nr:ThuA domain-containing protein [Planctomycetia bacterium]